MSEVDKLLQETMDLLEKIKRLENTIVRAVRESYQEGLRRGKDLQADGETVSQRLEGTARGLQI